MAVTTYENGKLYQISIIDFKHDPNNLCRRLSYRKCNNLEQLYVLMVKPAPSWKAVEAYLNDVKPAACHVLEIYFCFDTTPLYTFSGSCFSDILYKDYQMKYFRFIWIENVP